MKEAQDWLRRAALAVLVGLVLVAQTSCLGDGEQKTYAVGGTVTNLIGSGLLLQVNGHDELAVTTSGSFSFPVEFTDGVQYSVTVKVQPTVPTQTCTVLGGSGSIAGRSVNDVIVSCAAPVPTAPPARFVYVTEDKATMGFVDGHSIDAASGRLAYFGRFAADVAAGNLISDPTGSYVFVLNGSTTSVLRVDADGRLSQVDGSPFLVGGGLGSLAIHPTASRFYAGSSTTQNVAGITFDPEFGSITDFQLLLSGPGIATSLIMNPGGTVLYVNGVAFSIDANNGALTPVTGQSGEAVFQSDTAVIDPAGKFIYVASPDGVSGYGIDSNNGVLSLLAVSRPIGNGRPLSIAVHPSGRFLYTLESASAASSSISVYRIAVGIATPIMSIGLPTDIWPDDLAVDPSGDFVYVAASNGARGNILAYVVNQDSGSLATMPGSPFRGNSWQHRLILVR